jgi:hypothetical protein
MADRYTKAVLTVIAICLAAIAFRDVPVVKNAFAEGGLPVHVVVDSVSQFAFQFSTVPVECRSGCK